MGKKDYQKEHTDNILDDYVIARMRTHGEDFEVLIDPDAVEKFRGGKDVDILENMPAEKVFSDAKKGKEAPHDLLQEIFGTEDISEIAEQIMEKGDVQITTEQRKERQEMKRKEIINRIVRNSYNPQMNAPHPPKRVENALNEAEIHVDAFKPVSIQMDEIVDQIRELIPISFKKLKFGVTLRGDMYGKVYGVLKEYGTVEDEQWLDDGRWQGIIKLSAGLRDEFFEKLNNKTQGEAEIELLEEK